MLETSWVEAVRLDVDVKAAEFVTVTAGTDNDEVAVSATVAPRMVENAVVEIELFAPTRKWVSEAAWLPAPVSSWEIWTKRYSEDRENAGAAHVTERV